jgi:hypothetical protein
MNLWTRLGILAALAVGFYFFLTGFLQTTPMFEAHRWHIALGLLGVGLLLWSTAFMGGDKAQAKPEGSEGHTNRYRSGEVWSDPNASSPRIFTVTYCGVILMLFGLITIAATPSTRKTVVAMARSFSALRSSAKSSSDASASKNTPRNTLHTKRSTMPLKLQGIIYKRSNPSAIINGKPVFVGEDVSGAKVVAITTGAVTLNVDGVEHVLALRTTSPAN